MAKIKLTTTEYHILGYAVHLEKTIDAAITTSRRIRKRIVKRMQQKGLLQYIGEVPMVDGDGGIIQPERYGPGYMITPLGKIAYDEARMNYEYKEEAP